MRSDIDPITFEVIKSALDMLADEMALVIMRTAYSHILRDAMDYSTAVCDSKRSICGARLNEPHPFGIISRCDEKSCP